jgi:hypothetical protein
MDPATINLTNLNLEPTSNKTRQRSILREFRQITKEKPWKYDDDCFKKFARLRFGAEKEFYSGDYQTLMETYFQLWTVQMETHTYSSALRLGQHIRVLLRAVDW